MRHILTFARIRFQRSLLSFYTRNINTTTRNLNTPFTKMTDNSTIDYFTKYKSAVTELLDGNHDYLTIYTCNNQSSRGSSTTPKVNKSSKSSQKLVLVLDSSFNPPHNAHAALFNLAVARYRDQSNGNVNVLLLMSTQNADKPGQSVDQYAHRACMLRLFAKDLTGNSLTTTATAATAEKKEVDTEAGTAINVEVGLTVHARFVDKFYQLLEQSKQQHQQTPDKEPEDLQVVFLAGFDTLVRILDPKYYSGQTLANALGGEFEKRVRFMVLTRVDDDSSKLSNLVPPTGTTKVIDEKDPNNTSSTDNADGTMNQVEYIKQLSNGDMPGVPAIWGTKIDLVQAIPQSLGISSTAVRRSAIEGNISKLESMVCKPVSDYIEKNGIYN